MNTPTTSKGMMLLMRCVTFVIRMFALDARSLALFRVWIAATTISDVMTRFPDAHHHYSDAGMFPREFILRSFTNYYWITVHMLSGAETVIQFLFIVEIIVAFFMLIGYKTKTMTIISWILVCSVQNRNYVLGHSGDTVHRLFLFVAIFLPLSRVFSVDRALERMRAVRESDIRRSSVAFDESERDRERRRLVNSEAKFEVVGFATALFIFQLLVMYFMAHHHKTGAEWREKGIAAWMALQLDYFRTWFGDLLLIWTPGVIFGNYAVLAWQYWGTIIYFMPVFNKYFRFLTCLGFFAMHAAFGLAFYLETFTWATLAACSGIIPAWTWDLALNFISRFFGQPIQIHVLPNCKTCLAFARILDEFLLPGKSSIYVADTLPPSASPCSCCGKSSDSSFLGIAVTDANKNVYYGPHALTVIAKSSPILYPLHFVLRMKWARNLLFISSRLTHAHPISSFPTSSTSSSFLEEGREQIDSKYAFLPNFEVTQDDEPTKFPFRVKSDKSEKFEKSEKSEKPEFAGVAVDPLHDLVGRKGYFEAQSHSQTFTFADVKEATKIGAKASKEVFVAFLLLLVICCNAGNINSQYGVPPGLHPVLWVFQLDQYWGMFAPRPPDITWWYNFEATLDDGTHVELFNNGAMHTFTPNIPHTYDKPDVHFSIGNHRWFKLFENGLNSHAQREEIRLYFGRWFCREYNMRNHGSKRVHKYSIHFMYERLNMDKMDGSRYPQAKETIWNHVCYDK